jgi:hypothetical protein
MENMLMGCCWVLRLLNLNILRKSKMTTDDDEGGLEKVCDLRIVDEPCTRKSFLENQRLATDTDMDIDKVMFISL